MNWLRKLFGPTKPGSTGSPKVPMPDELAFFRSLGPEIGPSVCKEGGCDRRTVEHSVMCRQHHFRMIKGKPWPFSDDAYIETRSREDLNLLHWKRSGEPQKWVGDRNGAWDQDTWLSLLRELQTSDFWPMKADDVGELLERLKWEWQRSRKEADVPRERQRLSAAHSTLSSSEDSSIYGAEFIGLREHLRRQGGTLSCIRCGTQVHVDLRQIEAEIRDRRSAEQQCGNRTVVLHYPTASEPRICKTCQGVACGNCAQDLLLRKREYREQLTPVIRRYLVKQLGFPALLNPAAVSMAMDQALEACFSPADTSTILCTKCKTDLLMGIDHITD